MENSSCQLQTSWATWIRQHSMGRNKIQLYPFPFYLPGPLCAVPTAFQPLPAHRDILYPNSAPKLVFSNTSDLPPQTLSSSSSCGQFKSFLKSFWYAVIKCVYTGNFTVFKGISALDASASPAGRRKGGLPRQGCGAAGILTLGLSTCHCAIFSPSQNGFGEGGKRNSL